MPPVTLMLKPASAACNLACRYCFYKDEAARRQVALRGQMSLATAEALVQKALAHAEGACTFAFQGGEPSLVGLDFYRAFVEFAARHNHKKLRINYAFQTNGLLLDDAWAAFFARHHFLVGISIDGTAALHDALRPGPAGEASHSGAMRAAALLAAHKVPFNILTVVTRPLARNIRQVYTYFKEQGFLYQQYIPCLDPLDAPGGEWALSAKEYGKFLRRLFDLWQQDLTKGQYVSVRYFDNLVQMLRGAPPESCSMQGVCAAQYVAEADGSVYPCDFYCLDEWCLGNVGAQDFAALDAKRQALGFVQRSLPQPAECKACPWLALCRNGCPRERMVQPDGGFGKNRYCEAYREFFSLAMPRLRTIAAGR